MNQVNSSYSNYLLLGKEAVPINEIPQKLGRYDRFISAYNESERVRLVFSQIQATTKHWLLFPEYGQWEIPPDSAQNTFECISKEEDEAIGEYLSEHPLAPNETVCIDTTGFIRPHIMYLLRLLFSSGRPKVDLLYSEPVTYQKGSNTSFSGDVSSVRLVKGYEGAHTIDTDGEYLVVGCSYDTKLMAAVASSRLRSRKIQIFPFPALRPHMYQENRIRTEECEIAFGEVAETLYAPAHDPFATAHVLSDFYQRWRKSIKNLYLSPLATKPQVIGFSLFYLWECIGEPVSITFPFSEAYNRETSTGISELWRYQIDFDLIRSLPVIHNEN